MHVRKNDQVMVIKGSDAGKQGKVLRVDGQKVWVEKLRLVKKHAKPSETNRQGGITDMEAPISISNVLPIPPRRTSRAASATR